MTRLQNKKSVGLTILTAMFVAMALGFADLVEQNQADAQISEFEELLEGVETEIQKIPNNTESSVNTTDTMQTEKILSQIAHVSAFDEVIRKQIL